MKIRILGNSLRFRLKKSELTIFAEEGKFSDKIVFGENELIYSLKYSNEETIHCYFLDNKITEDTIILHEPHALGTWRPKHVKPKRNK